MHITLDTSNPEDVALLGSIAALLGNPAPTTGTAKKAAAPKAEAAPAAAPDPEPSDTDDSMEAAVKRATDLVEIGKARVVKDALDTCGSDRVGNLPAEKLGEFLNLLTELGVKQIEAKLDAAQG